MFVFHHVLSCLGRASAWKMNVDRARAIVPLSSLSAYQLTFPSMAEVVPAEQTIYLVVEVKVV